MFNIAIKAHATSLRFMIIFDGLLIITLSEILYIYMIFIGMYT